MATSIAFVLAGSTSALSQTTATVVGTVKDAQGGLIPGATVTLVSEARGTSLEAVTTTTGDFVFPNIIGDTYTVRVSMNGFKTSERKGVAVSPGDRVVVGTIDLEVGTLAETVLVSGEAPMIQSQTGDRSFTVAQTQVENLPNSGRNFASFAALVPGVTSTIVTAGANAAITRLGGGTTNFLLDGVSNVDPGGNGQGLQLNMDAIAEVKVLSSAYQAEYGRSNGLQISGVTKSGTNQFRGSFFDIERNGKWNANSWSNEQNGIAKPVSKERDFGYSIGGPIGKPGGQNSFFFFFAQQFSPRTTGGAVNLFRVPTLLERQGDFSQSTDNTGAPFPYIRDTSSAFTTCSAADTRGCFADGGVLGRIPQNRLYGIGLNTLKMFPEPNTSGLNFNLRTVAPEDKRNTQQPMARVDYQASGKLRISARLAMQIATSKPVPGTIPGFNDTFQVLNSRRAPSVTGVYTLNSSTILETTWGMNDINQLNPLFNNAVTNRCTVGLCDFPLLFPDAGIVPPDSWDYSIIQKTGTPFMVNGEVLLPPVFTWGSRIANSGGVSAPPSLEYRNNIDYVRTNNLASSVTKLAGSHTFKFGVQWDHSRKVQIYGASGSVPFQGRINFGNDSNNPLDSGFGFANAALGIFSSYEQQAKFIEGNWVYDSIEGFVQDTWKVNSKLSLDYGLRITHQGPQWDVNMQPSNFLPEKWSASQAPQLYSPGCTSAVRPCPVANRVAIDPRTGTSLGANTSALVGTIVPNTGVLLNGIFQAGQGIPKTNYTWPAIALAPRVGFAYDITGQQRFVIRGGGGVFFDRPSGQYTFAQAGNPPTGQVSTVQYSTLQSIPPEGLQTTAPPLLSVFYYDAKIPTNVMWNSGLQMALPWSSALDVSYVGTHGYNLLAYGSSGLTTVESALDLNAPDLGAAYLPQNQDPTLGTSAIPGATVLRTDLLRPYRGLGTVYSSWPRFWTQYDSIQTSFNRRFSRGWQAGLNWTWSLRSTGNTSSPLHFVHNADGSISDDPHQPELDKLLSHSAASGNVVNTGNRPHLIKGNFVWALPKLRGTSPALSVVSAVVNDWQLSGVYTGGSGATYDARYSYQQNGQNVNLTGSPNYLARIKVSGDPGSGCSSNQYKQFNTEAFSGPGYNSIGNESGANLMRFCNLNFWDFAINRSISLTGGRTVQVRFDVFNAFNTVVYNAVQTQATFNSPATPTTVTNFQYSGDGTLNPTRLQPQTAGFGAATGAYPPRSAQLQVRFQF
jgi:hypothetical protein